MKSINIKIIFSASIDGIFNNFSNEEYNKIFNFLEKYNFYYHPIISSTNVKK
jgi:hypothetical protein